MRICEKLPITLCLAVTLLVSGLPIVAAGSHLSSRPAITLDICTPAQATSHSSIQSAAALTPSSAFSFLPASSVPAKAITLPFEARFADPPIAPPPESLA